MRQGRVKYGRLSDIHRCHGKLMPGDGKGLPHLEIIPMDIEIGRGAYAYGPSGTITTRRFYELQRSGNFVSTSQVNPSRYFEAFTSCLQQGKDILYLCFSSGLSGTFLSAQLCAKELGEEYPDNRILCVDTLAASIGEGVKEAMPSPNSITSIVSGLI